MENKRLSISLKFHRATKIKNLSGGNTGTNKWPQEWKKIYAKSYPRLNKVNFPRTAGVLKEPLGSVLLRRKSQRTFSNKKIGLAKLSSFLFYSAGVIPGSSKKWDNTRRFYPSAGGRFPLELYLLVHKGAKLKKGLYHYNPGLHVLEELISGDMLYQKTSFFTGQDWAKDAQIILIITAVFKRTQNKYGDRGYRHILIESGHLGQNIYLVGSALNLKVCAIGGFIDDDVNEILDLDTEEEAAIYMFAIGC